MRSLKSLACRAACLALFVAACSDDAGTLAPDPGSYGPSSAGVNGSSAAGRGQLPPTSNGGAGGVPSLGTTGSGLPAAGTPAGGSGALAGVGGAGASTAGSFANGASGGVSTGNGGSFGSGGFGVGAVGGAPTGGRAGAAFGGAGPSLGGHAGALAQGSAGKPGAAGAPANVPATFAAVTSIIQANCSICHGNRQPRLTNNANLYETLTSTTVKECGNNPLVKPDDPANSALLMLPNWECDDLVMPQGCIAALCITDAELATITAWIDAGAPSK